MPINKVPSCNCSPTDSRLQEQVQNFYENLPDGEVASGLSVGVMDGLDGQQPNITRCYSGYANVANETPISQDTVFEIGSVSKVFTTTMLAKTVNDGIIDLHEPAQTYFDKYGLSVSLPIYVDPNTGDESQMTILDLADYTSGIPDKSPTNTKGPNQYSFSMMHEYLKNLGDLPVKPGTQYKYVNTNFGLLAELVMLMGDFTTYDDALQNMIQDASLIMPKTGVIESNTPSVPHLAQGYNPNGTISKNYALPTWPSLQGAGGIYSTLDDMLNWLQFNLGVTESSYNDVLPLLQKVWFPAGKETGEGLGWFVTPPIISKNGGTSGFHSWIGFLQGSSAGAVILCNSALADGEQGSPVDQLGKTILDSLNNTSRN